MREFFVQFFHQMCFWLPAHKKKHTINPNYNETAIMRPTKHRDVGIWKVREKK